MVPHKMTPQKKTVCMMMAAAFSPLAFAAGVPVSPVVPSINDDFQFISSGSAIQIDHANRPEQPVGALDLAAQWKKWNEENSSETISGFFHLQTAQAGTDGINVQYVINDDMAKLDGKSRYLSIVHDANLDDAREVRATAGWVVNGAQLGTESDKVRFELYSAAARKQEGTSLDNLRNVHMLTFGDAGTNVYGDVINEMARYNAADGSIVDGKFNNITAITVRDGAVWHGDLLSKVVFDGALVETSETTEAKAEYVNYVQNDVKLYGGAHWGTARREISAPTRRRT